MIIMNNAPVNPAENYRKAAEKGFPEAQFQYGICLRDGKGVPQNQQEATEWFRKAANSGHPEAVQALSALQKPDSAVSQMSNTATTPANSPVTKTTAPENEQAKPLSPGLIVAIIIIVVIVLIVISNQSQKATHDQEFNQLMNGIQNAGQAGQTGDPRSITPP